jgi:ABC-2 type transport system permease protein
MSTSPERSAMATDARATFVLWQRDLMKFFGHRTRIAGALAQPLIFWLVLGGGLAGSFRAAGATGIGYTEYFYPGVLVMMLLFSAIFGTMSIIEDRSEGFLQAVLVAAASRPALVLGKTLGASTVALVQTALFLVFLPWSGFSAAMVNWPLLVLAMAFTALSLTALGFVLAWWLDSTQAYHAMMSVLLIPMWLLSGALFPSGGASSILAAIMRANPMTYSVEAIRRALYGSAGLPGTLGLEGSSLGLELGVLTGFAAVALGLAILLCSRRA